MLNWLRKLLKVQKAYVLNYQRVRKLKKGEMLIITLPDVDGDALNEFKKRWELELKKSKPNPIFVNSKMEFHVIKKKGVGSRGKKN